MGNGVLGPTSLHRGALACCAFVFFGTSSTLCITASEVNKKLPFNTTSANFLTEVLKFLVATVWWLKEGRGGQVTKRGFLLYSIPGLMYGVQNQLLYYGVFHLQPAMFQLASKLKFVSTAVLFRLVLKKTLTRLQWLGIFTLMLGMIISKSPLFSPESCKREALGNLPTDGSQTQLKGSKNFFLGICVVLTTSTISGVSGIANEYLLKKVDEGSPLMLKNMQLYLWGIGFNLIGSVFETSQAIDEGPTDFFHGFGMWVWIVIVLKSAEGVSISFIMRYLDNIVKCFASAILVYATTICSYLLFHEQIDFFFVLGLAVVTVALYLYFGPHNEVLKDHEDNGFFETQMKTIWNHKIGCSVFLAVLLLTGIGYESAAQWSSQNVVLGLTTKPEIIPTKAVENSSLDN